MATFNKFQAFVEAVAHGKHDLGSDTLMVALTNETNAPVATNSVLADLTEITSYVGLSTRVLSRLGSGQTTGTYTLDLDDLKLDASDTVPAFRYIVIYNSTPVTNDLICFYDYGAEIVLHDGDSFTIEFDATDKVLTLQ